MILTSATYDFSYQVKDDQLFIDFSNEAARDCTYTFSVNGNTLTLTGGEGTIAEPMSCTDRRNSRVNSQ